MPVRSASTVTRVGTSLLVVSALAGLALALFKYFSASPLADTVGGQLIVSCTAFLLVLALPVWRAPLPGWISYILHVVILLALLGTLFSAYFLQLPVLEAFMVVGLLAWLVDVFGRAFRGPRHPTASAGRPA